MKIIFLGNGEYGCDVLKILLFKSKFQDASLTWIVTNKDKWVNQLYKGEATKSIPLLVSSSAKATEKILKNILPDLIICASFGQILTASTLRTSKKYCYNFHPSLLPKYRGPSPIRSAIFNNESETGLTIFRINEELDAGEICFQTRLRITENDHYQDIYKKSLAASEQGMNQLYNNVINNTFIYTPQDHNLATYCQKINQWEGYLDFKKTVMYNLLRIRAFNKNPGAIIKLENNLRYLLKRGKHFKQEDSLYPYFEKNIKIGEISFLKKKIIIRAQDGFIEIENLQQEGRKLLSALAFINGWKGKKIMQTIAFKR